MQWHLRAPRRFSANPAQAAAPTKMQNATQRMKNSPISIPAWLLLSIWGSALALSCACMPMSCSHSPDGSGAHLD
jgi:hypothetical protein